MSAIRYVIKPKFNLNFLNFCNNHLSNYGDGFRRLNHFYYIFTCIVLYSYLYLDATEYNLRYANMNNHSLGRIRLFGIFH